MTALLQEFVAQAVLAPSVHNVQPVRWMIDDGTLVVMKDRNTSLPHADPDEHDLLTSAGAAIEGVALAASTHRLRTTVEPQTNAPGQGRYQRLAILRFEPGGEPDPLASEVAERASWRGPFSPIKNGDGALVKNLATENAAIISARENLLEVAKLADQASLVFMADSGFRHELVSWMRFRESDPRWSVDGLNAEAMNMNALEAIGARLLLGKPFDWLHKLGVAGALTSEAGRYKNASGLMVMHCNKGDSHLDKGRLLYRHWLRITQAGLAGNVVAALADDQATRQRLHSMLKLSDDRRVFTTFLFGRLPKGKSPGARARLHRDAYLLTREAASQ